LWNVDFSKRPASNSWLIHKLNTSIILSSTHG
jgi:hypothetical protein